MRGDARGGRGKDKDKDKNCAAAPDGGAGKRLQKAPARAGLFRAQLQVQTHSPSCRPWPANAQV